MRRAVEDRPSGAIHPDLQYVCVHSPSRRRVRFGLRNGGQPEPARFMVEVAARSPVGTAGSWVESTFVAES